MGPAVKPRLHPAWQRRPSCDQLYRQLYRQLCRQPCRQPEGRKGF